LWQSRGRVPTPVRAIACSVGVPKQIGIAVARIALGADYNARRTPDSPMARLARREHLELELTLPHQRSSDNINNLTYSRFVTADDSHDTAPASREVKNTLIAVDRFVTFA